MVPDALVENACRIAAHPALAASLVRRFLNGYVVMPNGCWEWKGAPHCSGYGQIRTGETTLRAHRVAYELFIGPVPDGLTVDHTCHNTNSVCRGGPTCRHRRCVNPAHLEAVTDRENILRSSGLAAINARKTHCPRGHPYDEANTYRRRSGIRQCRACERLRDAGRRIADTGAAPVSGEER